MYKKYLADTQIKNLFTDFNFEYNEKDLQPASYDFGISNDLGTVTLKKNEPVILNTNINLNNFLTSTQNINFEIASKSTPARLDLVVKPCINLDQSISLFLLSRSFDIIITGNDVLAQIKFYYRNS